jgi:hypothetical protein
MAKGQVSKKIISDKILEMFEGSFLYNDGKEIRIPIMEDGELIQIKCALTAAKVNVEPGSENAIPTAANVNNSENAFEPQTEQKIVEVSAEEKANLASLMKNLGL